MPYTLTVADKATGHAATYSLGDDRSYWPDMLTLAADEAATRAGQSWAVWWQTSGNYERGVIEGEHGARAVLARWTITADHPAGDTRCADDTCVACYGTFAISARADQALKRPAQQPPADTEVLRVLVDTVEYWHAMLGTQCHAAATVQLPRAIARLATYVANHPIA